MILEKTSNADWRKSLKKAKSLDDLEEIMKAFFGADFADVLNAIERVFARIKDPALRRMIDEGMAEELSAIKSEYARTSRKVAFRTLEKREIAIPEKEDARDTRLYIYGKSQGEDIRYEIVEANQINASHLPNSGFDKNPAYTLENERLYHKEIASQEKVLSNALALNPDFLLRDSVDANNGAPVIDHENNVLGGNSRVMSLQKAWETGGKKIGQYREALLKRAAELGFEIDEIERMKQPILVRKLKNKGS